MKCTTIAAFCIAGFIAGCETAPTTVEHAPVHTLVAVEAEGPEFEENRDFSTAEECELARSKAVAETTDTILFCIHKGAN